MVMSPRGVAAPMCGWDSPMAPAGISSGLGKPEGLLSPGVQDHVFEPLRRPLVPLELRDPGEACLTGSCSLLPARIPAPSSALSCPWDQGGRGRNLKA